MSEEAVGKRLSIGDRVGKYEVLKYIASGGMGTVYKARDVQSERVVALKILAPTLSKQPKMLSRFQREARAAARLDHENIVAIYEFGEHAGLHFMALEYVAGIDLQGYIENRRKRNQDVPPEEARQIVLQAARALKHAHEQKIVHRDVKPSNFLLTRKDGQLVVKLTDLGLAIQTSDEEFRLTRVGTTVGTVDYMAPEQARNSSSADIRSDIYSLGCTFYHILAGNAPFAHGTLTERLLQHLQDEAPDVRKLNKEVPPGYVAILHRMLAKKPEDRYQSPAELLRDLEDPDRAIRPTDKPAAAPAAANPRISPGRSRGEPAIPEPAAKSRSPRKLREVPDTQHELRLPPDSDGATGGRKDVKKPARLPVPPWVFFVVGGATVLVVALVGLIMSTGGSREIKKSAEAPVTVPPVVASDPDLNKKDAPLPKVAEDGDRVGPPAPNLSQLFEPKLPLDAIALRGEFYGPFATFPQPPAGAPVQIVGRWAAGGVGAVRSLAEALAQAPLGPSVIEIHDRGPVFVGNLPILDGRDVFLRGGPGFRPLLAWEPTRLAAKEKSPAVLFGLRRGRLVVEGLDVVVKWTDAQADVPACLFHAAAGQLHLRDCTFSLAGQYPRGIYLARLQRMDGAAAQDRDVEPQLRLSNCYARGDDLMALAVDGTSADVLIDHSLLVGNHLPLLSVACRDEDDVKMRIVRSTLVTAQNLLRCQDVSGKSGAPRLTGLAWDSILARNDASAPTGDLVSMSGGAEPSRMKWRAVNSVYAGWKRLFADGATAVDGGDLKAWHKLWHYAQGDGAVLETWPSNPPAQLDDLPAVVFYAYDTPVAFAASASTGPIGAAIGRLPFAPAEWLKRTYERPALAMPAAADVDAPAIDAATDGLYHGERIEVPATGDVGLILAKLLQGKPLAPRVVFHITGRGDHACTPLRVQGLTELVLYFEPAKAEPLTLRVDPKGALERAAVFEVERGSLELIGASIHLENSRSAIVPPHVLKVAGGHLRMHRCQLRGPLGKSPDSFRSLIAIAGPASAPLDCRLTECQLLSGKGVLRVAGAAVRLSARNNVVLALGDALQLDLAGVPETAQTTCQLDNNTWALRRALLALKPGPYLTERTDLVLVQASANYFTDPFGKQPGQSALLRIPEPLLARGQLNWHGKGNAFDRRLESYHALAGAAPAGKQTLADWQQLWGRAGEQDAISVEPGPANKTTIDVDAPQLERLALPAQMLFAPGNPRPGADLVRLGLLRKKG
jgi:eukaryotic-like serine/threonine-protein kinase